MEKMETIARQFRLVERRNTSQGNECICRGTGWVRTDEGVKRCECLKQRIRNSQLDAIPVRFRDATLENYQPIDHTEARALELVREYQGGSLFLWGNYGRGKTHLACAQYRELVEAGQSCIFRSMSELLSELRAAEVKDETSIVLQRIRYADSFHLFIDDIDKFKATEFKGEILFDLFDTLYRRKLNVTITSNFGLAALGELGSIHPAIIRRIDEMCQAVEV